MPTVTVDLKPGQSLNLGRVTLTICEPEKPNKARVGVDAPPSVTIRRAELPAAPAPRRRRGGGR